MYIAEYPLKTESCGLPFVLCGIGETDCQQRLMREDGYCIYQIIYAAGGKGTIIYDGKKYELSSGDAAVFMTNTPYEYFETDAPWKIKWITFSGECMDRTLHKLELDTFSIIHFDNLFVVDEIFRRMLDKVMTKDRLCVYNTAPALCAFLTELFRQKQINRKNTLSYDPSVLAPAIQYIECNFRKQITLEQLAETINVTPEHFCALFKAKLQVRPFEYIALRRMQEAKRLLTTTSMSISEIGNAVGYADKSYFGSVFKKYERISPSEFRGNF